MGLIFVPLVGGLVLVEHGFSVGAMAEHGGDGHQHGYHAHGKGDRAERPLVLNVLGLFLQLLGFVGFHGVASVFHSLGTCSKITCRARA